MKKIILQCGEFRWFSYGAPDIREHQPIVQAAHSIYFQILGQHGFVALGLYLLLIFSTLRSCGKLAARTTGEPGLKWIGNYASAIQVSLIGYMVSGAFVSVAYFDLAWIYYAFTAILARELSQHDAASYKPAVSTNEARTGRPPVQAEPMPSHVSFRSRRSGGD
jgi:O-antigen ligase